MESTVSASANLLQVDRDRLAAAYQTVLAELNSQRTESGYWIGELSASALSTATAISALSFYLDKANPTESLKTKITEQVQAGVQWLAAQQNDDGGFGDTDRSYSNISTTMLAIAALIAARVAEPHAELIQKARQYVEKMGGVDGLRKRYGIDKTFAVPILSNCAMAGDVAWKEVSALPFEAACVPQAMYRWMQLPVVSYAIPALVAIGQAKFFHDPPWNPLARLARKLSVQRSLKVLRKIQPASGGYLEAVPLTSFVVMGLATTGRANHAVVQSGVRFIVDSFRPEGSWPIDTNLATWNTTLSINAICRLFADEDGAAVGLPIDSGKVSSQFRDCFRLSVEAINRSCQQDCLDWLLSCQNTTVHPFTGARPGGWGWSDLSGAVPDADDTPGALLALENLLRHASLSPSQRNAIHTAAEQGIRWLLSLQNRDQGWPTFCRGWGKLPFDRSGADITAHALRALHAWRDELSESKFVSQARIDRAIARGVKYLEQHQRDDGSWLPLWFGNQDMPDDENPVYGTSKVLLALQDLGLNETSAARRGFAWLQRNQNPDGGWGGEKSLARGDIRSSSVEETALAVEALSGAPDLTQHAACVDNGAAWLIDAVENGGYREVSPIGFYFAKLWYHERLYPIIFTLSALGAVTSRIR